MFHSSFADFRPGVLFHGRYRIVRCIKAGSMGAVYEALDSNTDSRRALKVMLPCITEDADLRNRFEREARVTGHIESDHLVRVSDAGVDQATGTPFLVMDLLRGEELGRLVRRRKVLPPAEVTTYLFQAALALDKTHAAGIVHRDLKPENMFVTRRDDGSPCIKILDFGIAKVVAQSQQGNATRVMGTPLYMAPEQIRGEAIGPQADLYALGHIAYRLLVGEPYWVEDSRALGAVFPLLERIMEGAKERPSVRAARRSGVMLPRAFDKWFLKATAACPEDRFERATTAVIELGEALGVSFRGAALLAAEVDLSVSTLVPPMSVSPSGGSQPLSQRPTLPSPQRIRSATKRYASSPESPLQADESGPHAARMEMTSAASIAVSRPRNGFGWSMAFSVVVVMGTGALGVYDLPRTVHAGAPAENLSGPAVCSAPARAPIAPAVPDSAPEGEPPVIASAIPAVHSAAVPGPSARPAPSKATSPARPRARFLRPKPARTEID